MFVEFIIRTLLLVSATPRGDAMQSISSPGLKIVSPWMLGRNADLCIFFLPVPFALAFYFLSQSNLVSQSAFWATVVACGMAVGPLHQGPTLFTYFDKKNRDYYCSTRRNKILFFVMPPVLVLTSVLASFGCPLALFIIVSLWHIHHLVQQNIRLLDIYHSHDKSDNQAIPNAELESTTIWISALVFTLISCARTNFVGLQCLPGLNILIGALSFWLVVRCICYLADLNKQVKAGAALNVPALAFWVTTVLSMLPVALWGKDFFAPFVVPLMIHWIHFIGLNIFLVNRRAEQNKVSSKAVFNPQCMLFIFSWVYMLTYVFLQRLADPEITGLDWLRTLALGIVMGLAMCHYFLDTYIWRFHEAYQSKEFLPYLRAKGAAGNLAE